MSMQPSPALSNVRHSQRTCRTLLSCNSGWAPSCPAATQVASRLWILWGVVNLAPGPTTSGALKLLQLPGGITLQLSLTTLLAAWSLSEIIRYSFFAFKVGDSRLRMCALRMSLYYTSY